jgi:hypothetical protein
VSRLRIRWSVARAGLIGRGTLLYSHENGRSGRIHRLSPGQIADLFAS